MKNAHLSFLFILSSCSIILHNNQKVCYDKPLGVIDRYIDSMSSYGFYPDYDIRDFFKLYADSVNNYSETQILPHFFYYTCFDYRYSGYWPDGFHPICLRVGILSKVTNQKSLEQIMRNKKYRKILKMKCSRNVVEPVPNNDISFYTLMLIRLDKIKQEKNNLRGRDEKKL